MIDSLVVIFTKQENYHPCGKKQTINSNAVLSLRIL